MKNLFREKYNINKTIRIEFVDGNWMEVFLKNLYIISTVHNNIVEIQISNNGVDYGVLSKNDDFVDGISWGANCRILPYVIKSITPWPRKYKNLNLERYWQHYEFFCSGYTI